MPANPNNRPTLIALTRPSSDLFEFAEFFLSDAPAGRHLDLEAARIQVDRFIAIERVRLDAAHVSRQQAGMLYRRFGGRTELQVPVLSCGGMRYQQSWSANDPVSKDNQSNLERTMRAALEHGICHLETARGYGTSEKQMGQVLPKLPRDRIIVQTKVSPTENPGQFEHDVRDSLSRLQLPWVDLLALHGVNDATVLNWAIRPGGCLERALQLKSQGLARHIGFSSHASTDVIIKAIQDGRFDYVNLHYYWAFQNHASAVREAAACDMGVFIISPSDKGGHLYAPPRKLVELTAPLSPMVFNDLWCLAHAEVHTISIGPKLASDFDEHLKAVALLDERSNDPRALIAPIEARLRETLESALGKEWANGAHSGSTRASPPHVCG